jgi:hypothetical protein
MFDFNEGTMSGSGIITTAFIQPGTWWVMVTRPGLSRRSFDLMLADFKAVGYEVYVPLKLHRRRVMRRGIRTGKREWVKEVLLPGYVFVREAWGARPIKSPQRVYGVQCRVGVAFQRWIDFLMERETEVKVCVDGVTETWTGLVDDAGDKAFLGKASKGKMHVEDWRLALSSGDEVEFEVAGGLMLRGLVSANAEGRLTIFADVMGRSSRFFVDLPTKVKRPDNH